MVAREEALPKFHASLDMSRTVVLILLGMLHSYGCDVLDNPNNAYCDLFNSVSLGELRRSSAARFVRDTVEDF